MAEFTVVCSVKCVVTCVTEVTLARGWIISCVSCGSDPTGPLHDPVTWYGINYTGTQVTQWDFQNKGTHTSPARLFFVLKAPLCYLRPSIINSVPCDRFVQRACFSLFLFLFTCFVFIIIIIFFFFFAFSCNDDRVNWRKVTKHEVNL